MESKLNDSRLNNKFGLSLKGQCLFVQRWTELFNPNTQDTYQFKIRNTHWQLREILDVIQDVKSGTIHFANLTDLIAEGRDLLMNDTCFKTYNTPLWGRTVENLKKPKADDKPGLLRLEYHIRHTLKFIDDKYLDWILTDLKHSIDTNDLDMIYELTGSLGSELVNLDWSSRSLNRLVRFCFLDKKNTIPFDDKWRKFLQEINAPVAVFKCAFECTENIPPVDVMEVLGLKSFTGNEIIASYSSSKCEQYIQSSNTYILVEWRARPNDLNYAVEQSNEYILSRQSILSYAMNTIKLSKDIVVIFPDGKCSLYDLDQSWKKPSRYVEPRTELIESIQEILLSDRLDVETRTRFLNLFKQYRLGIESMSLETWFTSLWIALESFLVTQQYDSIIEHVKQIAPSILSSKYIRRLLLNFLIDCFKCKVAPTFKGVRVNTSAPDENDIDCLLNLFKDPVELMNLKRLCSKNSLLEYRCSQLESSLSTNKNVKARLERHFEGVSWHIQRLYRYRNALFHSGQQDTTLLPLTMHLNIYIREIVVEVASRLLTHSFSNLGELFAFMVDNHLAVIEVLNQKPVYDNELVLKGAL